jgi:uncharacterized protein
MEPFASLDGGRIAVVADPAGAVSGVWQPGGYRGAQLVSEAGAWSVSALSTSDPDVPRDAVATMAPASGDEGPVRWSVDLWSMTLTGRPRGSPSWTARS